MMVQWIIFICLMASIAWGCYEDKGRYDYTPLNEIEIKNVSSMYTCTMGEALKITPVINYVSDTTVSRNWSYEWKIEKLKVIGEEKELNYICEKIGTFDCFLKVTDQSTGLEFIRAFKLRVTARYTTGWLVLSEVNGISRVNYIKPKGSSYELLDHIFERENGYVLNGKPVRLLEHWVGDYQYEGNGEVMIMQHGGEGSVEVDDASFGKVMTLEKEFLGQVYPVNFEIKDAYHGNWISLAVSEDGSLYKRVNVSNSGFHSGYFLQTPAYLDEKGMEVDRILRVGARESEFALLYDRKHRRMFGISDEKKNAGEIQKLKYKDGRPEGFDDITGMDAQRSLVFTGGFPEPYVSDCLIRNVVKSETSGTHYVQTFKVTSSMEIINPRQREFQRPELINGKNVFCTFNRSGKGGNIFLFSSGNVLYHYVDDDNLSGADAVSEIASFPSEIVCIQHDKVEFVMSNAVVAVGLANGEVYLMELSERPGDPAKELYHAGDLGKIVNICFKSNNPYQL